MQHLGDISPDLRHPDYIKLDFSFASEYTGPYPSHQVHRVLPVDLSSISVASSFSATAPALDDASIPVVHPVSHHPKSRIADQGTCCSISSGVGLDAAAESSDNISRSNHLVLVEANTKSSLQTTHLSDSEFAPCSISSSEGRIYIEAEERAPRQGGGAPKIVRKGSCHQCGKGSWLTRKETCIVCCSQYCRNCVRRCMGSMPEGRKCIACIGLPVSEKMRDSLGSSVHLLKKLFTPLEVDQILRRETSCEANLPSPEAVILNRKALCEEEVSLLHNCSCPPKKLEPGRYWYDKVSGLWGKEGKKPSQFITPQLNVGGILTRDASSGNTNILINNREITKAEQLMLKSAGIYCDNRISFWVSPDGSCQEEGHKFVKGPIWEKATTKIVCALLGLPLPPKGLIHHSEEADISSITEKSVHKLLLLGPSGSGTSTFYKQAKILYNVTFTDEERECIKLMIQCNLYNHLGILSRAREMFEKEALAELIELPSSSSEENDGGDKRTAYTIRRRLKTFSDWVVQMAESGNVETIDPCENTHLVEELWKDPSIQSTYNRRNELPMFPGSAHYFLSRAAEILRPDYVPSDTDILCTEGITIADSLVSMEFYFPSTVTDEGEEGPYWHDPSSRYQMTRVHPQLLPGTGGSEWPDMFEDGDADLLLFCVSLADYDRTCTDGANKMMQNRSLFEATVAHPAFRDKAVLLVLTKFDLLAEMIERAPLTRCEWFADFDQGESRASSSAGAPLAQRAFHHVARKFKTLFWGVAGKKLFVAQAVVLDVGGVDETLRYAREVLKWEKECLHFAMDEQDSLVC